MKKTLVILAAGIGNRYGGAKQITPVGPCGEKIIDFSVYDAYKAGFEKVVFIIRKSLGRFSRSDRKPDFKIHGSRLCFSGN